jgi:hypothetical protein
MANVFVEERNGEYVALENRAVICRGSTQSECGERAHNLRPNATIYGERVRNTTVGHPDKWRVLHHPKY